MQDWYLLYSKPRQEFLALENLLHQGYNAYCPRWRTRQRRQGRYASIIAPMFPRYLFIHLDDENDNWGPIHFTKGVVNLVRFGTYPARVPNSVITTLIGQEDEFGIQEISEPALKLNDPVRITEGPLAGYETVFHARTGKERVQLLLKMADKYVRLETNVDEIAHVLS